MKRSKVLLMLSMAVLVVVNPGSASAETWLNAYNAPVNTLPAAQGWTLSDTGGSPTVTTSAGIMHMGLTTVGGNQCWDKSDVVNDFTASPSFVLETELMVIESSIVNQTSRWRTGFSIYIGDKNKRHFIIGISDTGVRLTNDYDWSFSASSLFIPVDTTSSFKVYRFVVTNGIGHLYMNNSPIVSLSVGSPTTYAKNVVMFGDCTMYGNSKIDLCYLRYGVDGVAQPIVGTNNRALRDPICIPASRKYQFGLWGRATVLDQYTFTLDDGSNAPVLVIAPGYSGVATGNYVRVDGLLAPNTTPVLSLNRN